MAKRTATRKLARKRSSTAAKTAPAASGDSPFDANDWKALTAAIELSPELTIAALAIKRFEATKMRYPIAKPEDLAKLLPRTRAELQNYEIGKKDIVACLNSELFPITNDHELARTVFIGLNRCKAAALWASQAPPNAEIALRNFRRNEKALEAFAQEAQSRAKKVTGPSKGRAKR